jgi:hypothetical protein
MSESEELTCGEHGSTPTTYACRHLATGIACGFHFDDGDPSDRWPDAWCDACEEQRLAAGGWTDELTVALVKVLCTHCWEAARARNERIPALARGKAARLTEDEQERFIAAAAEYLKRTQDAAQARWKIGQFARWDFDDAKRTVTFSDDGVPRLIADVRMVGSYSTKSSTFQWSWVLYDDDEPMIQGVVDLPGFGEVRGIEKLTTNWWECEIGEAWDMTAVAAYLVGCDAVYRAPFDDLFWFMLLSNLRESA